MLRKGGACLLIGQPVGSGCCRVYRRCGMLRVFALGSVGQNEENEAFCFSPTKKTTG